jgi:hypothetical protein
MLISMLILACTVATDAAPADPRSIFDRCCTHYGELSGFAVTLQYTPPATPLVGPDMAQQHRLDFSGAKPDKVRITQHIPGPGAMHIISDGRQLVMALPARNIFSRHAAPADMEQARREIPLGGAVDGMSELCFSLLASDPSAALMADSQRLSHEGTTTLGEATCDVIRLHPKPSDFVPEGMFVDLLIARGEHPWVLGYDLNLPAMPERGMPRPAVIEIRARDWKAIDAESDAFAFAVGESKQVDSVIEVLRSQAQPAPPPPADITPPGTTP